MRFELLALITFVVLIGLLIIFVSIIASVISSSFNSSDTTSGSSNNGSYSLFTPAQKRFGNKGEALAQQAIESVLRDGDYYFRNISVTYDNRPAEFDNIIVNKNGVFIIEVKNYKGDVVGNVDDSEWKKYKTTDAGNTYIKSFQNPIKQVKRQVYILAKYLDYYGARAWVEGYVIMIQGNSPVESEYILKNNSDIDRAIHNCSRRMLNKETVKRIVSLLT